MSSDFHKNRPIKYNFSGLEEEVARVLRSFSADSVLKAINREATKILRSDSRIRGVESVKIPFVNSATKSKQVQEVYIQTWGLIDLAYYVVLWSNDHRAQSIQSDSELYALALAVEQLKERHEETALPDTNSSHLKTMCFFYGVAGEQFKHQEIGEVFNCLHRELFILLDIGKTISEGLDVETEFIRITGMSWRTMLANLYILWGAFQYNDTLSDVISNVHCRNEEDLRLIEKSANSYASAYEEIRNSPLKRQIFYAKPFVRTQRGEVVSISPFVVLSCIEHSIQWTIRNDYMSRGIRVEKFTSFFGKCFEGYFLHLLGKYLSADEYRKIEEGREKRADWEINIDSYKILVEQKASLLRLDVKQQETNIGHLEEYARKALREAIEQLNTTEASLQNGKYIKIILLYEDYLFDEFLDYVFSDPDFPIKNDNFYWMVTIGEMEQLLFLRKNDPVKFEQVMREKTSREVCQNKDGKSFDQILRKKGCKKNRHLQGEEFLKYKEMIQNETRRILL